MKKALLALLGIAICTSGFAQHAGTGRRPAARHGEGAGYASRDATVLSMMGWGLGIAVGIAALCALIENNSGGGHAH